MPEEAEDQQECDLQQVRRQGRKSRGHADVPFLQGTGYSSQIAANRARHGAAGNIYLMSFANDTY